MTIAIAIYGFVASVLPVWLLLCPRDYLSSYLKIGTVAALVVGTIIVNPTLKMPPLTEFVHGGGPIVPGKVFPFVFITIMCGAISGFHALVSSGTTPKMLSKESHARSIGYGAMLIESLVGVVALIAAASLPPGDYFAINIDLAKQAHWMPILEKMGFHVENLRVYEAAVARGAAGTLRRGGLARRRHGADLLGDPVLPLARLVLVPLRDHVRGALHPDDDRHRHADRALPGAGGRGAPAPEARPDRLAARHDRLDRARRRRLVGYFIWTGSIDTIWPMFGISNQLLAVVALAVAGTVLVNVGRARYLWVTVVPMLWVSTTTLTAGYQLVFQRFLPAARTATERAIVFKSTLNAWLTIIMVLCVIVILADALRRWIAVARGTAAPIPELAPAPIDPNRPPERCC